MYKVECRRGFYTYGCFHVIKTFVKDTAPIENTRNSPLTTEARFESFTNYVRVLPKAKIASTANVIHEQESRKSPDNFQGIPPVYDPASWYNKYYNMDKQDGVGTSDRFNNPLEQSTITDHKIYFPDNPIFQNRNI